MMNRTAKFADRTQCAGTADADSLLYAGCSDIWPTAYSGAVVRRAAIPRNAQ